MRRRHLLAVPAIALLLVGGPLGGAASAAPPVISSGTSQITEFLTDPPVLSEDVQRFTATSRTEGEDDRYAGQTTSELSCVGSTRSFVCHGWTEAVGTFDGDPAGWSAWTVFRCDFSTLLCRGLNIITSGSDALAGTRGLTTFETHAVFGTGTYTTMLFGVGDG